MTTNRKRKRGEFYFTNDIPQVFRDDLPPQAAPRPQVPQGESDWDGFSDQRGTGTGEWSVFRPRKRTRLLETSEG